MTSESKISSPFTIFKALKYKVLVPSEEKRISYASDDVKVLYKDPSMEYAHPSNLAGIVGVAVIV
jgi:hypothetical protein